MTRSWRSWERLHVTFSRTWMPCMIIWLQSIREWGPLPSDVPSGKRMARSFFITTPKGRAWNTSWLESLRLVRTTKILIWFTPSSYGWRKNGPLFPSLQSSWSHREVFPDSPFDSSGSFFSSLPNVLMDVMEDQSIVLLLPHPFLTLNLLTLGFVCLVTAERESLLFHLDYFLLFVYSRRIESSNIYVKEWSEIGRIQDPFLCRKNHQVIKKRL